MQLTSPGLAFRHFATLSVNKLQTDVCRVTNERAPAVVETASGAGSNARDKLLTSVGPG